jgi:hypothetical protein
MIKVSEKSKDIPFPNWPADSCNPYARPHFSLLRKRISDKLPQLVFSQNLACAQKFRFRGK